MPVKGCQHSKRQQRRIVTEINLHQQFNPNNKKQQRHVDRIDKKKHEDPENCFRQSNVICWIYCTDFATKSLLQLNPSLSVLV